VREHRQPNRGDAPIDHCANSLCRDRRHLPAAYITRPAGDRHDSLCFRPAIDVVLNVLSRFHRIVARNDFEEQACISAKEARPRQRIGILLALMDMAVDVDGVLDFDIGGCTTPGLYCVRRVGRHATFMRRRRSFVGAHGLNLRLTGGLDSHSAGFFLSAAVVIAKRFIA
jgi:hypothetical protein